MLSFLANRIKTIILRDYVHISGYPIKFYSYYDWRRLGGPKTSYKVFTSVYTAHNNQNFVAVVYRSNFSLVFFYYFKRPFRSLFLRAKHPELCI